jgi:hypothetical protein
VIITVYSEAPRFPASDQHPEAKRYQVGSYVVDATGAAPTEAEIAAFLAPAAAEPPPSDEVADLRAALAEQTRRLDALLTSIANAR